MPRKKPTIAEIRRAVAEYMSSEGCSCCQDRERHEKNHDTLGKLLSVPAKDGYRSFLPFRSRR
jgi:hypothetical protein